MASSQTRWDAARRTATVCLESAVPEGVDVEGDLRRLHNVVDAALDESRTILTVELHNERDICHVEDCLRRHGLIQTLRWEDGNP